MLYRVLQGNWRATTHASQQQATGVHRDQATADAELRWGAHLSIWMSTVSSNLAKVQAASCIGVYVFLCSHASALLMPTGDVRRPPHVAPHEWDAPADEDECVAQAADGAMNSFCSMTL